MKTNELDTNELEVVVNGNKVVITLTDEQIKKLQYKKAWYEDRKFNGGVLSVTSGTRGNVDWIDISESMDINRLFEPQYVFNNKAQVQMATEYMNLFIEMYNFCELRNGGKKVDWNNHNQLKYGMGHHRYGTPQNRNSYSFCTCGHYQMNFFAFGLVVLTQAHADEMLEIFGERIKSVYSQLQNY